MKLFILGQEIELKETVIAQTKQVNDITSLETRQTNYTNSFTIPRTAKNTRTLRFLGLVGNNANVPYQKNEASLFSDSGECFVFEGRAVIYETDNDYKCNIYDGNLELYKAIENKTLSDLDLTPLSHEKTTAEVVATFDDSKPYKYILADYNGKALYDTDKINIDYLVPSVRVSWLIESIETYSGYTINGSFKSDTNYTDLVMTYPKGNAVDNSVTRIFEYEVTPLAVNDSIEQLNVNTFRALKQITIFLNVGDDYQTVEESGNYFITVYPTVNDIERNVGRLTLEIGDVLSVDYVESGDGYVREGSSWIQFIDKYNSQSIDFVDELKGMTMRDFLNEIVWRFGLTLFKDKYTDSYDFKTLSEITNFSNAIDWSKKFISQQSEKYIFGSYAQNNYMRLKYNNDNADYNDGFLSIANVNLEDSKTIIQSKIYSPEENNSFLLGFQAGVYKLWDKEIKDDSTVTYKNLSGKFYFMKSVTTVFDPAITVGSENLQTSQSVTTAFTENYIGLSFSQIIYNNYPAIKKILNQSKVLIGEFNLKDSDVCNIDFSVPYFIEQLGNYFMLNKINNFIPGEPTTVELVKLNYAVTTVQTIPDYSEDYSSDYSK
jgi:hypothetical protein